MQTLAAIDIGSNSCRLKIAKVVAHQLRTVHEDREVTRLGASVFESGLVSPEAMAATLRALKRFQRAVQTHGVDRIRVVATAAMRMRATGRRFRPGEGGDGLDDGDNLRARGRTADSPRGDGWGLWQGGAGGGRARAAGGPGGGSCEITLSEKKRIKETISVPLGAVRLTEEFLTADPAPADGLGRMRRWIAKELRRRTGGFCRGRNRREDDGDCHVGDGGGAE